MVAGSFGVRLRILLLTGLLLASRPLGAAQLDDWDFPPPGLKNYLAKLYAAESEVRLAACSEQPVPAEEIAAGYVVTLQDEVDCLEEILLRQEMILNDPYRAYVSWAYPSPSDWPLYQDLRTSAQYESGWPLPSRNPADAVFRENEALRLKIYRALLIDHILQYYALRLERGQ